MYCKKPEKGEMPTCFFKVVNSDISTVKNFNIQGFVEFYLQNQMTKIED